MVKASSNCKRLDIERHDNQGKRFCEKQRRLKQTKKTENKDSEKEQVETRRKGNKLLKVKNKGEEKNGEGNTMILIKNIKDIRRRNIFFKNKETKIKTKWRCSKAATDDAHNPWPPCRRRHRSAAARSPRDHLQRQISALSVRSASKIHRRRRIATDKDQQRLSNLKIAKTRKR